MAKRTVQVNVMMTPEGAQKIDQLRKHLTRSQFIREAMAHGIRMGYEVREVL